MDKSQRVNLWSIILGCSWTASILYYGFLWNDFSAGSPDKVPSVQTVLLCIHFLALLATSFIISVKNSKQLISIGMISSLVLSLFIWFIPGIRVYYAAFALLGVTTGVMYAGFCVRFIYSFTQNIRIKATALYLLGMYFIPYALDYIYKILDHNIVFITVTLLLAAAFYLLQISRDETLTSSESILESPFPYKLIILLAVVLLIGYFNSGMIVTNIYNFYGPSLAKWPIVLIEQVSLLLVYLVFCFINSRINRFAILYFAFIFIGFTYLFCIISNTDNTFARITSVIAVSLFHLFTFSFVADIALKYGRNLNVLRAAILAVVIGAIAGELIGKEGGKLYAGNNILLFGVSMGILFVSLMIIPWLAGYINAMKPADLKLKTPEDNVGIMTDKAIPEAAVSEASVVQLKIRTVNTATPAWNELLISANSKLPAVKRLTAKELEAAVLLIDRLDYKTIAEEMNITVNTLKVHIKHIYQKLDVSSKKQLAEALALITEKAGI